MSERTVGFDADGLPVDGGPGGVDDRVSHALLDAVLGLAGDLELRDLLARIVGRARDLTGAAYGALGVLRPEWASTPGPRLSSFDQVGLTPQQVEQIGPLPEGHGMLGLLVEDPRVLRLTDLTAHPASVGFPAEHPPMHTLLGVPVRVRGAVFGNLYLTEKPGGFTADDQRLVEGLAAAAGVAIENARLFDEAQSRQRWLAAAAHLAPQLSVDLRLAARLVADAAFDADRCRGVLVSLPGVADVAGATGDAGGLGPSDPTGSFEVDAVAGDLERLSGPDSAGRSRARPAHRRGPGGRTGWSRVTCCWSPARSTTRPLGVIALHRETAYRADEGEMVIAFASHVSLAIDHALNEHNRQRLAVYTDRDRIARDLHDHVIQRIFAVGLGLQSTVRRLNDPALTDRVVGYINALDATIVDIRSTIFSLQHEESGEVRSLRTELFGVVADLSEVLGSDPRVTLVGPLDRVVPDDLRADLLAVVRESLTNVVKHAHASRVSLTVTADPEARLLRVQVDDNGVGIGAERAGGDGLRNAEVRAGYAGGRAEVDRRPEGGTRFVWQVPLPD